VKKLFLILSICFLATTVHAADVTLTVTMKDLKVAKSSQYFLKVHPMPKIFDPKCTQEQIVEGDCALVDEFANTKLWIQAYLKRHLYQQLKRGKNTLNREADVPISDMDEYLQ